MNDIMQISGQSGSKVFSFEFNKLQILNRISEEYLSRMVAHFVP